MRKFCSVLAVLCLALAAVAGSASGATGNAHFIRNASGLSQHGPTVTCFFKEAGLASGSVETVTCGAIATTTYECVNGGGINPSASNKTTTQTAVSKTGKFTADKSGNIVGSVDLSPPSAADLGFSCPPGQTTTFVRVSYSNVSITDKTSGATLALPGTYSYTNPLAP